MRSYLQRASCGVEHNPKPVSGLVLSGLSMIAGAMMKLFGSLEPTFVKLLPQARYTPDTHSVLAVMFIPKRKVHDTNPTKTPAFENITGHNFPPVCHFCPDLSELCKCCTLLKLF